jgi:hypothetical protein
VAVLKLGVQLLINSIKSYLSTIKACHCAKALNAHTSIIVLFFVFVCIPALIRVSLVASQWIVLF